MNVIPNINPHIQEGEKIDRDSYEPAYIQLANILRSQLAKGVFRPGDQLPSEAQLVQRYAISPMTVRRSINLLADQGLVSTAQGRGTFVKPLEVSSAIFDLQDLQEFFKRGSAGSIKLLDARVVSADERTARKLGLETAAPVIYIRRLFSMDGAPVFYHRAYLVYDPTLPIVEAEMDVTSLQGMFTGGSKTLLKCGQLSVEATLMNEEEAALLKKSLPAAAFYLQHVFYGFDNQPISWGWFIIPSEHLHFTTRVGIDR
jgi:DNA-binding GntR family transcriptional regulator